MRLLTAHWAFDNSMLGKDETNNGLNLQASSGRPSKSERDPTRKIGSFALRFDGTSSMSIDANASNSYKLNPKKQNFTVSFYFLAETPGFLISKGNRFSYEEGWSFFIAEDNNKDWWLRFRINSVPGIMRHRSAIALKLENDSKNGWHHVIGTINRDSGVVQMWLDGYKECSNADIIQYKFNPVIRGGDFNRNSSYTDVIVENDASIESSQPLELGRRNDPNPNVPDRDRWYLKGYMDDIRIYNDDILLNKNEIARLAEIDYHRIDDFTQFKYYSPLTSCLLNVTSIIAPQLSDDSNTSNAPMNNKFFGFPVSARAGNSAIIFFTRKVFHSFSCDDPGNPRENEDYLNSASGVVALLSEDGGNHWSNELIHLPNVFRNETAGKKYLVGGLKAIGATNNAIFAMNANGTFKYLNNFGWRALPEAYSTVQVPQGVSIFVGPRILEVMDIVTGNPILCIFHSRVKDANNLKFAMGYSKDNGAHWEQVIWKTTTTYFRPVEPMAMVYNNQIIILARNFIKVKDANGKYEYRYIVMVATNQGLPNVANASIEFPFLLKNTTLEVLPRYLRYNGDWQDTIDLIYNPISKNFETLLTKRIDYNPVIKAKRPKMTISLWSINPADMLSLSNTNLVWKYETEILAFRHRWREGPIPIDGLHNAASYIDGEDHITHFYSGYKCWGSAIFELRRTLHTDVLVRTLLYLETEYKKKPIPAVNHTYLEDDVNDFSIDTIETRTDEVDITDDDLLTEEEDVDSNVYDKDGICDIPKDENPFETDGICIINNNLSFFHSSQSVRETLSVTSAGYRLQNPINMLLSRQAIQTNHISLQSATSLIELVLLLRLLMYMISFLLPKTQEARTSHTIKNTKSFHHNHKLALFQNKTQSINIKDHATQYGKQNGISSGEDLKLSGHNSDVKEHAPKKSSKI